MTGLANDVLVVARERLEEILAVTEHSQGTSAELFKQVREAIQSPAIADSQIRWMECWTSSVAIARTNLVAMLKISSRTVDSWLSFLQKRTAKVSVRVPKATRG
jgi:hypothetical protein